MLWIFRYAFPEGRLDKPKSKLIAILEYRRDVFVINNVSKHKQQYIPRSVLCCVCAMLPQSPQVQQRREYRNNSLPWTYGHTVAASIKEEKTAHKAYYPSQSTTIHPLPFLHRGGYKQKKPNYCSCYRDARIMMAQHFNLSTLENTVQQAEECTLVAIALRVLCLWFIVSPIVLL